jgi:hypothetical protein
VASGFSRKDAKEVEHMNNRIALSCALAIALIGSGAVRAGSDARATEVLAAARKAIGDRKLESLKTLTVEASVQRNVNTMQMTSDVEILLELPDKYLRSDASSGPMSMTMNSGFVGDKVIRPANAASMAGGMMVIRMGPGGPMPAGEKPSPDEQARIDKQMIRSSRAEISRLMLGWFATTHPAIAAEYTYAGEAESPDGKADVIDAKNADGFSARLFIDRGTRLPLMVTYQGPQLRMITAGGPPQAGQRNGVRVAPGAERREMTDDERKKAREAAEKQLDELRNQPPATVEFTLFFDDWRDAGGIQFPHRIRRASAGTTNEEWTVGKVRVNPKLDPKKFEG